MNPGPKSRVRDIARRFYTDAKEDSFPAQEILLGKLVDQVLVGNLAPGMKEVIDHALESGGSRKQILAHALRASKGAYPLTMAAIEAYLDEKGIQ